MSMSRFCVIQSRRAEVPELALPLGPKRILSLRERGKNRDCKEGMSTANWLQLREFACKDQTLTKRRGSDDIATSPRRGQRDVHHNVAHSHMSLILCNALNSIRGAFLGRASGDSKEPTMANVKAGMVLKRESLTIMCLCSFVAVLFLSPLMADPATAMTSCQLMSIACKLTAGPGWSCGAARVKPKCLQVEHPPSLPGAHGTSQTRCHEKRNSSSCCSFGSGRGQQKSQVIKASQNASAPTNQQESGFLACRLKDCRPSVI